MLTLLLLLQIREHLIKGAGSLPHSIDVDRFCLLSAVQKAILLLSHAYKPHQAIIGNKKKSYSMYKSNAVSLNSPFWTLLSEFAVRFHSIVAWREDAASCQEVLPLISFLSHRYLLIHPLGLMSSRRKFCTHSLFCAPVINSSRVMWPVEFRFSLQD